MDAPATQRSRTADLSAIGYSNGFTLWHYRCQRGDDPKAAGFWAFAASMLRLGDVIHVQMPVHGDNGWTFAFTRTFAVYAKHETTGEVMVGVVS